MRITNNALTGNYLRNLNKNLRRMQTTQNQLSSLKEVSKSSDNPMLVSKIMNLNHAIQGNEQYEKNISDSIGWTDTADGALNDVSATLLRARELIQYGANGTLSETDRLALKDEVDMLKGQLTQVLNTNYDGRYIFGGQKTTEPPFDQTSGTMTYKGDAGQIHREIGQGVNISIEADGGLIVTADKASVGNKDLGSLIANISKALEDGDSDALSGKLLGDMDAHIDNVVRFRSKMGANSNRLEAAQQRNKSENLGMKTILSNNEDIDLAEKMMEYSMMSTAYQASLSTGAKILQPSLLDYLR